MAWVQGLVPIADLVPTLADLFEQGGWQIVSEGSQDFVARTTTDPEAAMRAPKAVKAERTGEEATGDGIAGGETYFYAVTAVGPKGESVASQEVEITQPATPERVRITWRHVDGALRYHIYRRHGTGDLLRVGTTASQCNMFTDDGAEPQAGVTPPEGERLTMFLRIRRQANTRTELLVQAGDDYSQNALANPCSEFPLAYWTRQNTSWLTDQHRVLYFGNINPNRAALVLYGDPTVDFSAYRVAFLYAGRLVPFPESGEDVEGNWAVFGSALSDYDSEPTTYGPRTANGINNVAVYKTKTGILWQQHELAMVTQRTQMQLEPKGFNPSQWTEKYHLSPVYVVHGYDGYRGWLEDVLAVQAHNVVHLDEFILSYPDGAEERYKYLHLNPQDRSPFKQASPNQNYSIAILKE